MENVDIIMPAYHCEKYIKDAIQSIKKQTNPHWRLIIIDDFSNDHTLQEIENSIRGIEEKVILIKSQEHLGVAKVRNLGLEKATNRYIAFMDADDIWNERKLEKQLNFMKENEYAFTYTLYSYLKKDKKKEAGCFPKSLNYEQALKNTFILTSTVMLDTNQVPKQYIKMLDIKSEDTKTWWNILKHGITAYGLEENLVLYRVTKTGLSSNKLKNLSRTWNLYRKQEGLTVGKSIHCFINYTFRAMMKRIV